MTALRRQKKYLIFIKMTCSCMLMFRNLMESNTGMNGNVMMEMAGMDEDMTEAKT